MVSCAAPVDVPYPPGRAGRMDAIAGRSALAAESSGLGYRGWDGAEWALSRHFLHTGDFDIRNLRAEHLTEIATAITDFGSSDVVTFHGSPERHRQVARALYLTCAKFVTTPACAPRRRRGRRIELKLAEDAGARGWPREVERHTCTAGRLERLLGDLDEPLDGAEADAVDTETPPRTTPEIV